MLLAKVNWYMTAPHLRNHYGKPVEVYRGDIYERPGAATFIPLKRIKSKFVPVFESLHNISVVVVLVRDRNFNI